MSIFHKTESFLGVDIGAGGIKLVELHKTKGRPQLWTYGITERSFDVHQKEYEKTVEVLSAEGAEILGEETGKKNIPAIIHLDDPRIADYAEALKTLVKQCKVTTRRATASLPVSYVFHSLVTLPFVPEKDREAILKAEVSKIVSRPIEELQVIFQLIPGMSEKDKYLRFLVTAAPKDLVAFYTAIFQKAGLELIELETEAFAVERSLVGHDTATAMVVDIGSERTNFFIIDNGLPMTHRSIQVGGNMIDEILKSALGLDIHISQIARDLSRVDTTKIPPELFARVASPIIKEIEYSFDLYLTQTGNEQKRPEKIILSGGSAFFPPLQQAIKDAFGVKVFIGDPWARVVYQQGLRPILAEIGPRMAVSIGLALRNFL